MHIFFLQIQKDFQLLYKDLPPLNQLQDFVLSKKTSLKEIALQVLCRLTAERQNERVSLFLSLVESNFLYVICLFDE